MFHWSVCFLLAFFFSSPFNVIAPFALSEVMHLTLNVFLLVIRGRLPRAERQLDNKLWLQKSFAMNHWQHFVCFNSPERFFNLQKSSYMTVNVRPRKHLFRLQKIIKASKTAFLMRWLEPQLTVTLIWTIVTQFMTQSSNSGNNNVTMSSDII